MSKQEIIMRLCTIGLVATLALALLVALLATNAQPPLPVIGYARVQRWLSWKVAPLLRGGTLLVNAAGAVRLATLPVVAQIPGQSGNPVLHRSDLAMTQNVRGRC